MNTNLGRASRRLLIAMSLVSLVCSSPAAFAAPGQQAASLAKAVAMSSVQPWQHEEVIDQKEYQIATVVIEAKPDEVWSVLTDYSRASSIFTNVKRLTVVKNEGPKKELAFEVTTLGGLYKFAYVLGINEQETKHRIEWHRVSGAFKANEGYWQLEPVEHGTLVTYAKHIEGGFLQPAVFINHELQRTMPVVMANLKAAVLKKHHIAASENCNS